VRIKLIVVLLVAASVVAACGTPAVPPAFPTSSAKPAATSAPSTLPTPPPSVLPTMPPSPIKPGVGLVTKPQAEEWQKAPQAALSARADLAQRLPIDIDTIKLVSVEQVDWPDACMGIQTPGIMCAQVITPGYKVVLEANGKQYEYHTNESGSGVRLAVSG
jgi:hypothetical protein